MILESRRRSNSKALTRLVSSLWWVLRQAPGYGDAPGWWLELRVEDGEAALLAPVPGSLVLAGCSAPARSGLRIPAGLQEQLDKTLVREPFK